jgi:hypothetical protein
MSAGPGPAGTSATAVFIDRREPKLKAGTYHVQVTQSVVSTDGTSVPAGSAGTTFSPPKRTFAVRGERFWLDPNELLARFPPPDNQGAYHNALPHVVFQRRTLPWERTVEQAGDTGATAGASWLALLLFDENEAPTPHLGTVSDLLRAPSGALPATVSSYTDACPAGHPFSLEYDESPDDPCTTIDVPVPLFAELVPSIADLNLLAHVRWVGAPGETYDGVSSAGAEHAVVVGSRLPLKDARSTVHLVSLEGMAPLLRGDNTGAAPAIAGSSVRLVSLASWSFTSTDPNETFAGYLKSVSVDTLCRPSPKAPAGASTPAGPAATAVTEAFGLGYTAMPHTTRLADRTVSWYRGPLLPGVADPGIVPPPDPGGANLLIVADAALRFDPATGMFDVSYAAAWQLGRLLALGTTSFAIALVTWRRSLIAQTAAAVAGQQVTSTAVASPVPGRPPAVLAAAVDALGTLLPDTPAPPDAAPAPPSSGTTAEHPPMITSSHAFARALQATVADPAAVAAAQGDVTVPAAVGDWLMSLTRLAGIPLPYLVPDAAMLPPEAIRFFRLDPNWIIALLGGATSVGRTSTADLQHDRAVASALHQQVVAEPVVTGFILRSAVVEGWPRLDVVAYAYEADGVTPAATPLGNLRVERIAPGILLCLVAGEIGQAHLREPPEGLHFGLDLDNSDNNILPTKELRSLTGASIGEPDPGTRAPVAYRGPDGRRILDVKATADAISAKLAAQRFTAAELALELIEGVQSVRFTATGARAR